MKERGPVTCALCGEPRMRGEAWFLLTENQWTDRLKILAWNDALADAPGVYAACGAAHVQQLVVHWMATGSLSFPFARGVASSGEAIRKRPRGTRTEPVEPDTAGSQILGELAVHRESLARVLRESPESLAGILEALISALSTHRRPPQAQEEVEDEADVCAMREA
jgi:hypothetical protein